MSEKKTLPPVVEPKTVRGGPKVMVFEAPEPVPKPQKKEKPPKKVIKPKVKEPKRIEGLTEREFVDRYKNEVVTASWDPKVLRKCGKGAKDILKSLGAKIKPEKIPFKEQQRRRRIRLEKEAIERGD